MWIFFKFPYKKKIDAMDSHFCEIFSLWAAIIEESPSVLFWRSLVFCQRRKVASRILNSQLASKIPILFSSNTSFFIFLPMLWNIYLIKIHIETEIQMPLHEVRWHNHCCINSLCVDESSHHIWEMMQEMLTKFLLDMEQIGVRNT